MKYVAKIVLLVVLLPVWIMWLIFDLAEFGCDYESWMLYDLFNS